MSQSVHYFALFVLIIGVCTFSNVNARYRRVYQQEQQNDQQSQDLSQQIQQRPQIQTKPFYFDQTQQRPPHRQPKPLPISQNQQNQNEQLSQSQQQQSSDQIGQISQSQQRPQVQPPISQQSQNNGEEDLSDENELQQIQQNQNQNQNEQKPQVPLEDFIDQNQQTQFIQDAEKYEKELDKEAELGGHKGKVTEKDAEIVGKKNEKKPWYIRLKNWGEKKINQIG